MPGLELFDAHTHLGENDPDGMRQSPEELLHGLRAAGARGCFVFPMHEPDGYPPANDFVIESAAGADGLFVPFCRVEPGRRRAGRGRARPRPRCQGHQAASARRAVHARPSATCRELFALANERTLPILIHAGRGIPALGEHVIAYAREYPNARVILAHAAVSDLAWIWRACVDLPNVLFDTAWWISQDLMALFTLVPPAQILFASDAPYGHDRRLSRLAAAAGAAGRAQRRAGRADRLGPVAADRSRRRAGGRRPGDR